MPDTAGADGGVFLEKGAKAGAGGGRGYQADGVAFDDFAAFDHEFEEAVFIALINDLLKGEAFLALVDAEVSHAREGELPHLVVVSGTAGFLVVTLFKEVAKADTFDDAADDGAPGLETTADFANGGGFALIKPVLNEGEDALANLFALLNDPTGFDGFVNGAVLGFGVFDVEVAHKEAAHVIC